MDGQDPEGPVVLLAHGWGATGATVLPLAALAAPVASSVVTYDVRGHGRSDRWPRVTIRQFRDDAARALEAVAERTHGCPVVMVGHSMGGAGAILAAERLLGGGGQGSPGEAAPGDKGDERSSRPFPLAGLVLVAAPFDVYDAIARYLDQRHLPGDLLVPVLKPFWKLRVGEPPWRLHPGRALERMAPLPVLVIQPEEDTRVVPSQGRALARASGTEMVMIPGRGHRDILDDDGMGEILRDFVAAAGTGRMPRPGGVSPGLS